MTSHFLERLNAFIVILKLKRECYFYGLKRNKYQSKIKLTFQYYFITIILLNQSATIVIFITMHKDIHNDSRFILEGETSQISQISQRMFMYGQRRDWLVLSNFSIKSVLYTEVNKIENLLVKFDCFV
jgi:hypothetical protein